MESAPESGARRSLWQLGRAQLDDGPLTLKVDGQPIELDRKSLEVLQLLLVHAGEVVTKEELFETVWAGRITVEGVLANAISRLRKLLGDEEQTLIVTHPRAGYRYAGPVSRKWLEGAGEALTLKADDPVPGREHWWLARPLGRCGQGEVWLAGHRKTGEQRVFKFAIDSARLSSLKREATLYRLLKQVLGERSDFARVLEWNFEQSPFFLECEFGGESLLDWASKPGGLNTVPLAERLRLLAETAEAVAAAHSAGVLHKDLKPANVLIYTGPDGKPHPRLTDFGSSRLADPMQLDALGITRLGFTVTQLDSGSSSGTPLYLAPELMAGQLPTVQSDVYALGVVLYQLVVGDLNKPLVAGWEQDVEDGLLREDIAAAANGSVGKRMAAATELAIRLSRLEARRLEQNAAVARLQEVQLAREALNRSAARRPWLLATGLVLLTGIIISTSLFYRARQSQRQAEHEVDVASAVKDFLAKDVVAAANPQYSNTPKVSLIDALKTAGTQLDTRFAKQPEVAANLRVKIGEALATLNDDPTRALADLQKGCSWMLAHYAANDQRRIDCLLSWTKAEINAGHYDATAPLLAQLKHAAQSPGTSAASANQVLLLEAQVLLSTQSNEAGRKLAETALRKALETKADSQEALEARLLLAKSFVSQWDYGDFLKEFSKLLEEARIRLGPDSPHFLEFRLERLKAMTNNTDLLEAEPDYAVLVPAIGKQLGTGSGLYLDALSWWAFNTDRISYYQRYGDVHVPAEQLKIFESRSDLWHQTLIDAELSRHGANSDAYVQAMFDAGRSHWNRKEMPEAIAQFERIFKAAPNLNERRDWWVNRMGNVLTTCYLDDEKPQQALPYLQAVDYELLQRLRPSFWKADSLLNWARYYQQIGESRRSADSFIEILKTTSDHPEYWRGSFFRDTLRQHKKLPPDERKRVFAEILALRDKHGSPPPEAREF